MTKAISIRQPWAGLIVAGIKDIENRAWRTSHRGLLLIHASLARSGRSLTDVAATYGLTLTPELVTLCALCGGIIGSVDLIDCVAQNSSPWYDGPIDSSGRNNYGLVLSQPRVLPFRPAAGRLGLFEAPDFCHPNCHRTALDEPEPDGTSVSLFAQTHQ